MPVTQPLRGSPAIGPVKSSHARLNQAQRWSGPDTQIMNGTASSASHARRSKPATGSTGGVDVCSTMITPRLAAPAHANATPAIGFRPGALRAFDIINRWLLCLLSQDPQVSLSEVERHIGHTRQR